MQVDGGAIGATAEHAAMSTPELGVGGRGEESGRVRLRGQRRGGGREGGIAGDTGGSPGSTGKRSLRGDGGREEGGASADAGKSGESSCVLAAEYKFEGSIW